MEEIQEICMDLTFPDDKEKIIRKYLLPHLMKDPKKLSNINVTLLGDIFNLLEKEEIYILQEEIEKIIGNIDLEEFLETHWKLGKCFKCEKIDILTKCKKDHEEECPYSETTSETGCLKAFCSECIFHLCSNDADCPAARCEACSYF